MGNGKSLGYSSPNDGNAKMNMYDLPEKYQMTNQMYNHDTTVCR